MILGVLVMAAKVWHYWIGVALVLASIATVVALAVQYLAKVQAPQYPKRPKR
jgi:hypothetical protein